MDNLVACLDTHQSAEIGGGGTKKATADLLETEIKRFRPFAENRHIGFSGADADILSLTRIFSVQFKTFSHETVFGHRPSAIG